MQYSLLYELVCVRMLLWQNGKDWLDIHWFQASVKAGEICALAKSGVQCLLVAVCFLANFWPFFTKSIVLHPVAQKKHLTHYWKALCFLCWSSSAKFCWQNSWSFFLENNFDPDLLHLPNLHFPVVSIYKNQTNQPQSIKQPPYIGIHRFLFFENSCNNQVNEVFAKKIWCLLKST